MECVSPRELTTLNQPSDGHIIPGRNPEHPGRQNLVIEATRVPFRIGTNYRCSVQISVDFDSRLSDSTLIRTEDPISSSIYNDIPYWTQSYRISD
jgi:hypothetical protein